MRTKVTAIFLVGFVLLSSISLPQQSSAAPADGVGVATSNLELFYDVNNPNGISGTTLKDLSGNSRDATITQVSSQPSKSTSNGGHLSFNGNGGFATAPQYNFPNYSGISVSFYANFGNSADNFERIIDFGNRDADNNIEVGRIGTSSDFFAEAWTGTSSPGWCRANGSIDTNWHFWVVTFGNGYCNIYKDGVQLVNNYAYNSLPLAGSWSKMYIGKSNWADAAFEGGIAELAFYSRVLTPTERTQNYNAALDQTLPTYTGSSTFTPNENQSSVGSLSFSESVYISPVSGTGDTDKFSLSGNTLSFVENRNFEARNSVNASNTYLYYFKIMDLNGNQNSSTYTLTVNLQDLTESSSLSIPTLSSTPLKGVAVTITVTPTGDGTSIPGRVTYLMAGKRIAGCYKKVYSGTGNSTCSWRPTTLGNREITVVFTPTNSSFFSSTSRKSFWINKRTTNR